MPRDPHNTCDPKLEALLDDLLAPEQPHRGLADRIVAQTTVRLNAAQESLLNAALEAPAVPEGLVDQILDKTDLPLYRRQHPVLGFIGRSPAYRTAACILLSAMVGIWTTLGMIFLDAHRLAEMDGQLFQLARVAQAADADFDRELAALELQLEHLQARGPWDSDRLAYDLGVIERPVQEIVVDMPWLF